jgi:curved DNA-binding protein CbpA
MSTGRSLYDVLGVPSGASDRDLLVARRRLALRWHPDHNAGDARRATRELQTINEAYDVLSDPERRRAYDAERVADNGAGFEFICGEMGVIATGDRVRCVVGSRANEFDRTSIRRVLVRRHAFSPGWATLVVVTATSRHQLRLPLDAAKALAAALTD